METDKRNSGKIKKTVLFVSAAAALLWISYIQQLSPLCRAMAGQPVRGGENPVIAVDSNYILKIVSGGMELEKAAVKKEGKICASPGQDNIKYIKTGLAQTDKTADFFAFSGSWRRHPAFFAAAIKKTFGPESRNATNLNFIEKMSLLHMLLNQKKENFAQGAHRPLPVYGEKENLSADSNKSKKDSNYSQTENVFKKSTCKKENCGIEIINASGKKEMTAKAEEWLKLRGFVPFAVSGMMAAQKKTEIFSYGGKTAAELRNFICAGSAAEECCQLKDMPVRKDSSSEKIYTALVLGEDAGKFFKTAAAEAERKKENKTAKTRSLKKLRTHKKTDRINK